MTGAKENPKKRELKDCSNSTWKKEDAAGCKGKSQETGIERVVVFAVLVSFGFFGCKGKSQETGIESHYGFAPLGLARGLLFCSPYDLKAYILFQSYGIM